MAVGRTTIGGTGAGALALGPRERLAAEASAPTSGYFFRQAGTMQAANDKNWVWILADTADRAKVLLSAD